MLEMQGKEIFGHVIRHFKESEDPLPFFHIITQVILTLSQWN
jgi:hypothetical protein